MTVIVPKSNKLTLDDVNVWQHKDIIEDSIPGISLDKAYRELLDTKKGDTIIIAVIDTRLDINHEEIKNYIWTNKNEIPENKIDDDGNGYIDDIHGWNFLADKNGKNLFDLNYSYVRFYREYKVKFNGKLESEIHKQDIYDYRLFVSAKKKIQSELNLRKSNISYLDSLKNDGILVFNKLKKIFPNKSLNQDSLDSLQSKDTTVVNYIKKYSYYLNIREPIDERLESEHKYLNVYLNEEYDDVKLFKDNFNNIRDTNYGNNKVSSDIDIFNHSTQVTGIIVADRNNSIGIKGITNTAKIMPVCISPSGNERDKDIALGIRYAVDNGASIINITFTKDYPLHNDWVISALKHAAKNDVLVVSSSGNDYTDLDTQDSYPNDSKNGESEYVDNFIKVGASWFKLNERMVTHFSNYGKREVDIFAPGKNIYTTLSNNKYKHTDGTSISAPMVSGVAALIRSYYPNLTAAEVKQIIMKSGVSLNIMVNKPSTSKEKELVPFSSLSKSGKIVNAYNALLMAEKVSKKKKKSKK
ncbi:S8 family serine peptidase [Kordia sp.]|uniref:S8 family serine peptidase n=1 Tax=Kordia sp. TaxID=1965332 RepID=UPI003D6BB79D